MKRRRRLSRALLTASLLLLGAGMARAQFVLIPDTSMRAWLNMMAPGCVDSAGYLDTLSPALVMPPWVTSVSVYVNWSPSDLTGLQYLQGFDDLLVQYSQPGTASLPAFPDSLDRITMRNYTGGTLPTLPSSLTKLFLQDCSGLVSLPTLPSGIDVLQVDGCLQLGALPALPSDLYHLTVSECTNLSGLPSLPASLGYLTITSCPSVGPVLTVNPAIWSLGLEELPLLTSVVGAPSVKNVVLKNLPVLSTIPPIVTTCGQGSIFIENVPSLPLPTGPWNAHSVWITNMPWTALPAMPCVETLGLNLVPIGAFPPWPTTLGTLWIDSVPATGVLDLPPSLTELHLERAAISGIGAWPDDPQEVFVSDCDLLTMLPAAPLARADTFYYVYEAEFRDCPGLAELPKIIHPVHLTISGLPLLDSVSIVHKAVGSLVLENLPALTYFSSLPPGRTDIVDCPLLSCLPPLPDNCSSLPFPDGCIELTNTGVTCFPNYPSWVGTLGVPSSWPPLCNVTTSSCPEIRPVIAGLVFNDLDNNGVWDTGEPPMPNMTVEAGPGGFLGMSSTLGSYEIAADTATYQVSPLPPQYHVLTTPMQTTTFSSYLEIDTMDAFGVHQLPNVTDLVAHATAALPPVIGFDRSITLNVVNNGTVSADATIELDIDPSLAWVSSTVAPTQVTGTTVQWIVPAMSPGTTWTSDVILNTPVGTMLGDTTQLVFTAISLAADTTPGDNIASITEVVVASCDPNDKNVAPDQATPDEVALGLDLDYTIRFQNTGTWPASRVVITDTLSEDLDWSSFRFIASSHACTWYMLGGVLHFVFDPIYLPDSGMDELASNGFVRFMIKSEPGLINGAQIQNVANIYFDFNEPVITEPAVFMVDEALGMRSDTPGEVVIWPNPADDWLWLQPPSGGGVVQAFEVFDPQGRMVLQGSGMGRLGLPVGQLKSGVYLLRVSSPSGAGSVRFIRR